MTICNRRCWRGNSDSQGGSNVAFIAHQVFALQRQQALTPVEVVDEAASGSGVCTGRCNVALHWGT